MLFCAHLQLYGTMISWFSLVRIVLILNIWQLTMVLYFTTLFVFILLKVWNICYNLDLGFIVTSVFEKIWYHKYLNPSFENHKNLFGNSLKMFLEPWSGPPDQGRVNSLLSFFRMNPSLSGKRRLTSWLKYQQGI